MNNLEVTDTDANLSTCSRSKQPFAAGIVGKSARSLQSICQQIHC